MGMKQTAAWKLDGDHWIWTGRLNRGRPEAIVGGAGTPAARALWQESYGVYLPKSRRIMRLCEEPLCVRPEHHCILSPTAMWDHLGRDREELNVASTYLRWGMHRVHRMSWTPPYSASPQDVGAAAITLGCDTLAVLAAWSKLARGHQEAQERASLERTSLAGDMAQRAAAAIRDHAEAPRT